MYKKKLSSYYNLFDRAPISAAVLEPKTFKVEMVNDKMLQLWGRPASILNLPLLDIMPEIASQRFPEILSNVSKNGTFWEEQGARVLLNRAGIEQYVFMDYSYTPIFEEGSKLSGILVMGTDVCEREINRLMIEQNHRNLRSLVSSAHVPMCIYEGENFDLVAINAAMINLWQQTEKREINILNHVYHNSRPYQLIENGVQFTYTPLLDGISGISGICVIASQL